MKTKLKVIACIFTALLTFSCSPTLAYADDSETIEQGREILDDTRYSAIGFAPLVKTITDFIGGVIAGEIADNIFSDGSGIDNFAINSAVDSYLSLKNYAVNSTSSVTIQEVTSLIGKRKIIYPYNDMYETDYFFVYINKNTGAQVQQFGDYSIAPNSILIVRQTSWSGVLVGSISIENTNNMIDCPYVSTMFTLRFGGDPAHYITVNTPDGSERFVLGSSRSGGYYDVNFVNSDYNTIQDMYLVDYYSSHNGSFGNFLNDGEPLDWIECILGCPIDNTYHNFTTIGSTGAVRPIYLTTLYSNDSGRDNTCFNKDPNNIDPQKTPVYILPNTHPLSNNKRITESTINNYNDYGITINNGTLDIDPDVLLSSLSPEINPTFQGVLDNTFSAQPQIGLDFNTPLDLDIPSIVNTYIDTLVPQLPSGEPWEPPSFPTIQTAPLVDYTYPVLPTETVPQNVIDDVGAVMGIGFDAIDALDITAILIALAVLGALGYFLWG